MSECRVIVGDQDLHYLRSILGNLREFKAFTTQRQRKGNVSALGIEVLADNVDWLDCFIDKCERSGP